MGLADRFIEARGAFELAYDRVANDHSRPLLDPTVFPEVEKYLPILAEAVREASFLSPHEMGELIFHPEKAQRGMGTANSLLFNYQLAAEGSSLANVERTLGEFEELSDFMSLVIAKLSTSTDLTAAERISHISGSKRVRLVQGTSEVKGDVLAQNYLAREREAYCFVFQGDVPQQVHNEVTDLLLARFGPHSPYFKKTGRHIRPYHVDPKSGLATIAQLDSVSEVHHFGDLSVAPAFFRVGGMFIDPEDIGVMVNELRSFGYSVSHGSSNSCLTDRLLAAGVPESLIEPLIQSVNMEVDRLDNIVTDTMTGIMGHGCVGRHVSPEGTYWFKIDTNYSAAYKSSRIPSLIHAKAEEGNELARALARRIPPSLSDLPIQVGEYYITFSKDARETVIKPDLVERYILTSEMGKGISLEMLQRIYTTALYHEVSTDLNKDNPDPLLSSEMFATNLDKEQLVARFNGRFTEFSSLFNRTIDGSYEEGCARLLEHQLSGSIQGIYDNKPENYVGACCVDLGISKQGDEVDDLARLMLGRGEFIKNPTLLNNYVGAYIRMRQEIQQQYRGEVTYNPSKDLSELVHLQLQYDTWKMMSWSVVRGKEKEVGQYARCAQEFV